MMLPEVQDVFQEPSLATLISSAQYFPRTAPVPYVTANPPPTNMDDRDRLG
jgi:hypothetical protein